MHIFLNGSRRHVESHPAIRALLHHIADLAKGDRLSVAAPFARTIAHLMPGEVNVIEPGQPVKADLALSLGGDGTFLRTAQWVGDAGIPILGINAGHLGYLADMTPEEFLQSDLSDTKVEERAMLHVTSEQNLPRGLWPYALNDVAILKTDTSSMITVDAHIDAMPLTSYRADGLILATPTGSTGYNLSVGGPIVQPNVPAIILSPVAPHSLTMRPLVVSSSSVIDLQVHSRSEVYLLSLDGRSVQLPVATRVRVVTAPFKIKVMQRADHHFAGTLRSKLLWGEDTVK